MPKHGPTTVSVTLEDAPGGTARDISVDILNGIEISVLARMVQIDGLGEVWERHIPTGKKGLDPITLEVTYDSASNETAAIFQEVDDGPEDDGRELVVDFGGTNGTVTVDVRLMKTTRLAGNESHQRIRAELQPTGAAVFS